MLIRVLGSAADGGFPQWNCGCANCRGVRTGTIRATPRTQESVAVSAGGRDWFLLNASPEIRQQIESFEPLHPRGPRHSPIGAIVLTNGDLDHCLGLLSLRESHPLVVYATERVRRGFTEANVLYRTLQRFPEHVTRKRPRSSSPRDLGAIGGLQHLSRRGVDAGTLPELRPARGRLRWVPVPGVPPRGRRDLDRPRLLAVPPPRAHSARARRGRGAGGGHVVHVPSAGHRAAMRRRVDPTLVILLGLIVIAVAVAFARDPASPFRALMVTGRLVRGVWVELVLGFLLAGLIEVLVPPSAMSRWLGAEQTGRGIVVGWLAGLLLPGGPYVFFPVAANLLRNGAAPGPLIALLTAKTLVSPIRMLTYEAPLLGWPLTLARFVPGVLLPPVMGVVGEWLFGVFKGR